MTVSRRERGISRARSMARRWPVLMMVGSWRLTVGREPLPTANCQPPTSHRATSSIGFCVADNPTLCRARPHTFSSRSRLSARCAPRLSEVLVDVGGERLERRDVDDAHFIRRRFAQQVVQRGEKRRQRLARAGRRGDEGVPPLADGRPPLLLGGGGGAERFREPALDDGVEEVEGHGESRISNNRLRQIYVFPSITYDGTGV